MDVTALLVGGDEQGDTTDGLIGCVRDLYRIGEAQCLFVGL